MILEAIFQVIFEAIASALAWLVREIKHVFRWTKRK